MRNLNIDPMAEYTLWCITSIGVGQMYFQSQKLELETH